MKKRMITCLTILLICLTMAAGCAKAEIAEEAGTAEAVEEAGTAEATEETGTAEEAAIEDGIYLASFDTDSSMIHVNETWKGKGVLTVKDGSMTIHIVMPSKNIVKLFSGLAEDAEKDGAVLIDPGIEEVTYDDGTKEEVYAFDVPVPCLDEEFDLALIGKKQKWYDHKVRVSDPEPYTEGSGPSDTEGNDSGSPGEGELTAEVSMTGGSGKASITSPARVREEDGKIIATVEWNSPHYDYMIVDGQRYEPVNTEGNSKFEIPIPGYDQDFTVIADTVAMSKPHEIEYVLNFKKPVLAAAKEADGKKSASEPQDRLDLSYATQFEVDFHEGGYKHIHIGDGMDYVMIPEGKSDTDLGLEKAVLIHEPVEDIYLAASSAMDLFVSLDSLDRIKTCATSASDYSIEEAKKRIESGKIKYAGKYSSPDYEMILSSGCDLAIESTMINHSPEIREELEKLGIPVFTERSSYEKNPLGRLEWVKLYGVLINKEKEAEEFFNAEVKKVLEVEEELEKLNKDNAERKNVAFFYMSSNGYINVRKSGDYVSSMINMAGGRYAYEDIPDDSDNALSTMNINWEEFYKDTVDADILIYNGTIDGGIGSVDELVKKNPLFADFKAVKEGNVYCSNADMFQKTASVSDIITDMYRVINDKDTGSLQFMNKIGK